MIIIRKTKNWILLMGLVISLYNCDHGSELEKTIVRSENVPIDYLQTGKDIAMSTQAILGKNLMTAIQEKGTEYAVTFCNEKAIVLTDSMSVALNAKIKRVSDNNRNPQNAAKNKELDYIRQAKLDITANGFADPIVFEQNGKMVGFYPIVTNDLCLKCHGDPEKIDPKTLETIKQHYPEDKGTGYTSNELRGIWVIEMSK